MSNRQEYVKQVKEWLIEVEKFVEDNRMDNENLADVLRKLELLITKSNEEELTEVEFINLQEMVTEAYAMLNVEVNTVEEEDRQSVPIGQHTLPPLPYSYNALEPYISEEIMKLHHDKHHQSYVDGLNKAELKMKEAREKNDYSLLKHWEREAAFHGSGHYLHTIFWENMSPKGGGEPTGPLMHQIKKDFGSFSAFKQHFSEAAKQVEGVGWAILVWSPRARRLEILQSERHMLLTQWDTIPLLVLDVWEHAYYLQYKNNRGEYVKQWWNLVKWPAVAKRFERASKLQWQPY